MSLFCAGLVRRCALCAIAFAALAMAASVPVSAATEVKWSQWKTTEVGEKFMAEFATELPSIDSPALPPNEAEVEKLLNAAPCYGIVMLPPK